MGFTLVEVLVAVMLIAFGCFAAGTMQIASLKSKDVAANAVTASFLVDSELERLKTLTINEISRLSDYEDKNLDKIGQKCLNSTCDGLSFDRKVRFFKGYPTALSYHLEIEVSWRDAAGPRSITHSAVLTGTAYN